MRKKLHLRLMALLFLLCTPVLSYCCLTFDSFTATTANCSTTLNWTFEECGEVGTYYVMYSTTGGGFGIIAAVSSGNPAANASASYTYTDNSSSPTSSGGTAYYQVVFVITNAQTSHYSNIVSQQFLNVSCSLNNGNRCSGMGSVGITGGPNVLCAGTSGTYSLTNGAVANWFVTSGNSFVALTNPSGVNNLNPVGSSIVLSTNSSANEATAVLAANVDGCMLVSAPITLGIPAAPGAISPNSSDEKLPSGSVAEFLSVGASSWTFTPANAGTIFAGQGGDDIGFRVSSSISSGTVKFTATGSNACGTGPGTSDTYAIVASGPSPLVQNKAIDSAGKASFSLSPTLTIAQPTLYPNPTTNSVQVLLPQTDFTRTYIKLYDVSGKLLRTVIPSGQTTQLDLSRQAKGVYIINIFDGNQLTTQKILRQ